MRTIHLSVMCGLSLSNLMLNSPVTALKYLTTSAREDHTFSQLLPFLDSFSMLCIVSYNIEITKDNHENHYIPFIFKDSIVNLYESCSSVVVFSVNNSQECFMLGSYIFINTLFLVSPTIDSKISDLEQCLYLVSTPEVVYMSLEEGLFYKLSPAYLQPRYFSSCSIREVFNHRHYPTKPNLQGSTVSVATMVQVPLFIVKNQENGEFDGLEERLISEMSRHLNFSPNYLIYENWGTLTPNGTWVGQIVVAMQEGLAELVVANLWQIPSLYSAMDFGPSMFKIQMGFLVRRQEKIDFRWRSVLTIFKPWVWFATLLSFVLVVAVYWAGVNWDLHSHSESWPGSIMTVLGHMTMTTSHRRVKDGNTCYTLTSWSLFSLLLTTCLSTGIVTRLVLPQYPARLDTIRQLVEHHYYWTVGYYRRFRPNKLIRDFMFNLKDPWVSAFEDTYIYLETEDVLKKLDTDSNIALPGEKFGENVVVLNTPGLREHKALKKFRFCKEVTSETHYSMGFKKKSPLFESLNALNLQFLAVGLVEHWKNEVGRRWPQYDTSHLSVELDILTIGEPEPLVFGKVRPVFFLLLFGLAISSLVLVMEIVWFITIK